MRSWSHMKQYNKNSFLGRLFFSYIDRGYAFVSVKPGETNTCMIRKAVIKELWYRFTHNGMFGTEFIKPYRLVMFVVLVTELILYPKLTLACLLGAGIGLLISSLFVFITDYVIPLFPSWERSNFPIMDFLYKVNQSVKRWGKNFKRKYICKEVIWLD